MDTFNYGTVVRLETIVRDEDDVAVDPTSLSLTYRKPSGAETTVAFAALTNETGAGVWSYGITVDQPGTWTYRWSSTVPTATDEGTFQVRASSIAGTAAAGTGPCQSWCTPQDLLAGGWDAPTDADTLLLEQACQAASEVLYERSGRRWPGLCWDSVLPQECTAGGGTPVVLPDGRGGMTMRISGSGGTHPHGPCTSGAVIDLGQANVTAVDAVRVDEVAVASTAYRLIDRRWVARVDGDSWPTSNPPDATTIALEVDFTHGESPPAMGVIAAVALAREIAKGLAQEACSIDPRVTAMVREGLSLDLSDVDAEGGLVEVPAVRRFMEAVNPHRLQRAAAVVIPGLTSWPSRV